MEVKILQSNNQEDQDFINNNPIFKKNLEDLYNEWNIELMEKNKRIRIRLPNLIEKYKDTLENIDGKYFS
jgi:hypothetical protein